MKTSNDYSKHTMDYKCFFCDCIINLKITEYCDFLLFFFSKVNLKYFFQVVLIYSTGKENVVTRRCDFVLNMFGSVVSIFGFAVGICDFCRENIWFYC